MKKTAGLFLILFTSFCAYSQMTSKFRIDTVTNNFTVYKESMFDRNAKYICALENNDTLVINAPIPLGLFGGHTLSTPKKQWQRIDYSEDYVFMDNKIYPSTYKSVYSDSAGKTEVLNLNSQLIFKAILKIERVSIVTQIYPFPINIIEFKGYFFVS